MNDDQIEIVTVIDARVTNVRIEPRLQAVRWLRDAAKEMRGALVVRGAAEAAAAVERGASRVQWRRQRGGVDLVEVLGAA